jgi:hypothetical protein
MTSRIYPDRQPASDAAPMSAGIRRYRGSPASDLPVVDAESRPTRLDVHVFDGVHAEMGPQKDRRGPENRIGKPGRTLLPDHLDEGRTGPVSEKEAGPSSLDGVNRASRLIAALLRAS